MKDVNEAIVEVVSMLCSTWRVDITEQLLASYVMALSDMDPLIIQQAAGKALQVCTFMPKPAELRALVGNTDQHMATEAWNTVIAAIAKYGVYQSMNFDPVTNATVRELGGLAVVGAYQLNYIDQKKKQFIEVWLKKKNYQEIHRDDAYFLPGRQRVSGVGKWLEPIDISTCFEPMELPPLLTKGKTNE